MGRCGWVWSAKRRRLSAGQFQFGQGIVLMRKKNVVSSSRQHSQRLATARESTRRAVSMWSLGVRTESRPSKSPPWRPPESKPPSTNPCIFSGDLCKSLIFLKWHGRGQGFESLQVHQSSRVVISTRSFVRPQDTWRSRIPGTSTTITDPDHPDCFP